MARFVSTDDISACIEEIIKKSKKRLTLISPYVRPSESVFKLLLEANERGVKIELVYGKGELYQFVSKKMYSIKNIQIYFHKNLHAKCYFNEESLLITSMNLYDYSEKHNKEMGVFIEKFNDSRLFNDTINESKLITQQSVLRKSFGIDAVSMYEHLIEKKCDFSNEKFHLPSLSKIFIEKYPKYKDKTTLNGVLKVENFLRKGMDLEISNRVCFFPRDKEEYLKIKEINEGKIEIYLPEYRVYWMKTRVGIYPEENYKPMKNNNGLRIHLRKMISIIDTLHKHLKTKID